MTYHVVQFTNGSDEVQRFLDLPAQLYTIRTITQDYEEERRILTNGHPLSHYFSYDGFLVYRGETVVARALLVAYPGDSKGYVGYYECCDSDVAAKALFDAITTRGHELQMTSLIGPYNASFWLQYRLKLDGFDSPPYISEPSNLSYYMSQWEHNGFTQTHEYVSNEYSFHLNRGDVAQFTKAAKRARSKHYDIRSPRADDFEQTMRTVHGFITQLYSDFPGYKQITVEEFLAIARSFQPILDYHFIKIAYSDNKPVGFAVGFPDYGNLLSRPMTALSRLRIMVRKIRAPRYVIMYLGVLPEHEGLGRALVRPLAIEALLRGARTIGALALVHKVTAQYGANMIKNRYHYGLYEKGL